MKILVTGVAGFIGYHLAKSLINANYDLVGIDNLNIYYDLELKKARLAKLKKLNFSFYKIDICDQKKLENLFLKNNFDVIIHLAAQAGVRYSIENPQEYIQSNINGFFNVLELSRYNNIKHLIFASSSSIYGENENLSFEESQITDSPKNLYAASKKSNELISYSYANLFKLPCTGLRFFTVYGPWGRPDMAYFKFVKNIYDGKPIEIFGQGKMYRDFTYIDDIIEGILKILNNGPPLLHEKNVKTLNKTPWEIYNLGNNKSVSLEKFVNTIELLTEKKPTKIYLDLQPGDMKFTLADISKAQKKLDFNPQTSIKDGLFKFIEWYKSFYNLK
jgi:UDP-glucuronate 4-epimerase